MSPSKLVRDKVPGIIRQSGRPVIVSVAFDTGEFRKALLDKLVEEANEAHNATGLFYLAEELADLLEVIDAIMSIGPTLPQIYSAKARKRRKAGAFAKRLILDLNPDGTT